GLIGAGQVVGGAEVEHGGTQHALVGAADLGAEHSGEDQLPLHLFVAQLDVEIIALWAGGARGRRRCKARNCAQRREQRRKMPHVQSSPRKNALAAYWAPERAVKYAFHLRKCAPRPLCTDPRAEK